MLRSFLYIITALSITFLNCEPEYGNGNKNEFQHFIENIEEKQLETVSFISDNQSNINGFLRLVVDNLDQVIVVDDSNWTIHLLNQKGEQITSVGGKGRGPGEFMVINDLSITSDNILYVLDKQSHKVATYLIDKNTITHQQDYPLPDYSPLSLVSLEMTNSQGLIGVFRELRREPGVSSTLQVSRLDSEFEIEENLFEMPGNETIQLRGIAAVDSPFGFRTYWHIHDDYFFYSHSNELAFTSVNLKSLESKKVQLSDSMPAHTMTAELKEFLVEHFEMMIQTYPEAEKAINEKENLPYFRNFIVVNGYVFFDVFPDNPEHAHVLGYDRQTGDKFTIKVPLWHSASGFLDNTLIGIVGNGFIDENNDILAIEF